MTKRTFEKGDTIGPYVIDEFGGTNTKEETCWWVKLNGQPKLVTEKTLHREIARAEWTPAKIRALSSRAYTELRQELGEDAIDEILGTTPQKPPEKSNIEKREIAAKWFASKPQIPQTRANVEVFNKALGALPNASYTSKDFDRVFVNELFNLELNPERAGITGYGQAIKGQAALSKLSAPQYQQIQRTSPVAQPDTRILGIDDAIKEIGNASATADEFLDNLRVLDRERGIDSPVPPLLMNDRKKLWAKFFELHRDVEPTQQLQQELLNALNEINEELAQKDEPSLPISLQSLDLALSRLANARSSAVTPQESGVYKYNGATWVQNPRQPTQPLPLHDSAPITVTLGEVNAMGSEEYGRKILNPEFDKAVRSLMANLGR